MSTAIAIKSKDGIVLASDSQGTIHDRKKITVEKVFKINKNIGLVGAGRDHQIGELVRHFQGIQEEYENEKKLTDCLNQYLFKLHEEKNNQEYAKIDLSSLDDTLYFSPEVLMGIKLKDDMFYLYHGQFGILEGSFKRRSISKIYVIDEYHTIGSGFVTARDFIEHVDNTYIKKLDKKISELPVEVNVGIAMYVICQAKKSDLYSGGDTQIGIVDNNEFRIISVDEQPKYYYKMITCLSELLKEKEDKIKESLPVSITKLL